ncbi:hypothetical protein GT347_19620 [Xylophilus rhododendri]|uniref:Type III secretion protein n=1 Tax=Xylophilus rhododendri TaxID=2697032 RepID=A0A857J7P5_9BURK|nr:hypothetical protein [Xylophilus rhododendri]QHI99994.1 hypothetical protein GT347_19620 [Xylophilus rhododendri]
MDQKQRAIRDFGTLVQVRRRRGQTLQAQLAEAVSEHERCLERQARREQDLQARRQSHGDYLLQLQDRTSHGRAVRLEDLQAGRRHAQALLLQCDEAAASLSAAGTAVDQALQACAELRRQIAANEALIASLDEQAGKWKKMLAAAAEEREEDERADGRTGAPAP